MGIIGQIRSSYKFHLYMAVKEDLTEEVTFDNLRSIGVNIGPQGQRDELIVLFNL